MKKFEYKIVDVPFNAWSGKIKIDLEITINELGMQGWELVLSQKNYEGATPFLIFKREIFAT